MTTSIRNRNRMVAEGLARIWLTRPTAITVAEAAEELGISRSTVRRYLRVARRIQPIGKNETGSLLYLPTDSFLATINRRRLRASAA